MKVYATVPGAEIQIPPYGTATNDRPCIVPTAVGAELSKVVGLRVEPDAPASPKHAAAPAKAKGKKE